MKWSGLRGTDRVLGGDVVDRGGTFEMRDKVQHCIGWLLL